MATTKPQQTNTQTKDQKPLTQDELEDAFLSAIGDARDISGALRIQHSDAWK